MRSATHFAVCMATIKGGMKLTSPVSSNMMTARMTVILLTPARKAAEPTMAKIPGDTPGIIWPTSRPKRAPASRAGIRTPDGTLQ